MVFITFSNVIVHTAFGCHVMLHFAVAYVCHFPDTILTIRHHIFILSHFLSLCLRHLKCVEIVGGSHFFFSTFISVPIFLSGHILTHNIHLYRYIFILGLWNGASKLWFKVNLLVPSCFITHLVWMNATVWIFGLNGAVCMNIYIYTHHILHSHTHTSSHTCWLLHKAHNQCC